MINIKALAVAAAVSAGFALAMPATSQAMPVGPIKVQTAQDSNIESVVYRKYRRHHWRWRESHRWYRGHYWAGGYCDPWYGCYHRRHYVRYYHPYYYDPYYYDDYYPYYGGYYGPGFYGPGIGIGFGFRIH